MSVTIGVTADDFTGATDVAGLLHRGGLSAAPAEAFEDLPAATGGSTIAGAFARRRVAPDGRSDDAFALPEPRATRILALPGRGRE